MNLNVRSRLCCKPYRLAILALAATVTYGVTVTSAIATTIVIGFSRSKIVIAADSRRGDENKPSQDDGCKISVLNDKFLFTNSGRYIERTNGVLGWDVSSEAKIALSKVSKFPLEFYLAKDVATEWKESLGPKIVQHIRPSELASLAPDRIYVDGFFLGLGPTGNTQAAYARVSTIAGVFPPRLHWPDVAEYEALDNMTFVVQGAPQEELAEFLHDTSPRAKYERANTILLSKTWSPEESEVRMVIRLEELLIKYTAYPEDVGGPIDAVELKKGGTVHWIQRKSNCAD